MEIEKPVLKVDKKPKKVKFVRKAKTTELRVDLEPHPNYNEDITKVLIF